MTLPRQRLPGTTYLVTRRVAQRVFLLKPTPISTKVVEYCFGSALDFHPGIELHALTVLSDHIHAEVTDYDASLPKFMAWVDREIAKSMNEYYGRSENFWASGHYSSVDLKDAATVWGKAVYIFTNAVKHGLVRYSQDWPGVCSSPRDWLRQPKIVERPNFYFNQNDDSRATVELRYTIPPQFRDRDPEELVREMTAAIEERQRELRAQARHEGKTFLGADRVLKESPFAQPKTPHIKGKLNPTFAASTAEGHRRARQQRQSFLFSHGEAFGKLRQGLPCLFPAGSYLWPRRCAAPCAPLSTATCTLDSS